METKEHILAIAQRLVQQRGFNGFSYADIAQEVGIRKASLHHHFPSKADLGVALVDTYAAQFDSELLRIKASFPSALARLNAYAAIYRASLEVDRICMCGMLGTETLTLDAAIVPKLKQFFVRNTAWLAQVLDAGRSQGELVFDGATADQARVILSTLQGASLVCRSTGDLAAFEQTAALLIANFTRKG